MTKFLITLLTAISLIAVMVPSTEAARIGGGKSFGKQSSNVSRQQAPAQSADTNQAKPASSAATPSAAPAKPASPWKGMLGGALLGLGLGALLSSMGIGAGMANIISMLLMAGAGIALVMFLMRMFRNKSSASPNMKGAYAGSTHSSATPEIGSRLNEPAQQKSSYREPAHHAPQSHYQSTADTNVSDSGATWEIPVGFDVAEFERTAQTYFIRLQAAWDKADINDIREFTTPEMYAEIKLQLQERGANSSVTDVITVHAKLLGIETLANDYLASVKFVGTLKEGVDAPTQSFDEVWNLIKPVTGQGGWLLAGIQQAE